MPATRRRCLTSVTKDFLKPKINGKLGGQGKQTRRTMRGRWPQFLKPPEWPILPNYLELMSGLTIGPKGMGNARAPLLYSRPPSHPLPPATSLSILASMVACVYCLLTAIPTSIAEQQTGPHNYSPTPFPSCPYQKIQFQMNTVGQWKCNSQWSLGTLHSIT